ncbi:hypothetical protein KFK09_008657 [Dendrobium nobile]|uniref:Uncharacterized protein n=1 Tax=Dendrobium nobile TaxID=94219 RepID=A0A8T3BQ47_DENNO|nr:hypothetical protein KFK09_008657 [Dendrobium nobile]
MIQYPNRKENTPLKDEFLFIWISRTWRTREARRRIKDRTRRLKKEDKEIKIQGTVYPSLKITCVILRIRIRVCWQWCPATLLFCKFWV